MRHPPPRFRWAQKIQVLEVQDLEVQGLEKVHPLASGTILKTV